MQDAVFFLAFAYILSLGMGMVIFQKSGIRKVNRFWWNLVSGTFRFVCRTIGDLFHWLGKQAKKP